MQKQNNYNEVQLFPLVIGITVILAGLYVAGNLVDGGYRHVFSELRFYLVLLVFLSPGFLWGVMKTEVTGEEIIIRFGLLPLKKRTIPLVTFRSASTADIRWLREYRFIGVTYGKNTGDLGYFVRYGGGVRCEVEQGSVFVGSSRPDRLAGVLRSIIGSRNKRNNLI